jgi:hypothetical protein
MKNYMIWIPFVVVVVLALSGCLTTETGEVYLKPETLETLDSVATATGPAGQAMLALSAFWPPLAMLGSFLVGAGGAYKKLKPKLEEASSAAELGELAGQATSAAIDEFKKAHPDEWQSLVGYFESYHGQTIENFYRALRGLPPKD